MSDFILDLQLARDCLTITDWPLCRIMRMKDKNYPWLVLVPRKNNIAEIFELDTKDQQILWKEVADIARILQDHTKAYKINVASLGNVVRQLHIHIVGRFTEDLAWPRPVWNVVPALPFTSHEEMNEIALWQSLLDHRRF